MGPPKNCRQVGKLAKLGLARKTSYATPHNNLVVLVFDLADESLNE